MISIVTMCLLHAGSSIAISFFIVSRDCVTIPLMVFRPTRMQPSESLAVFPLCMRTPEKYGTSNSSGSFFLNLADCVITTLYVPNGIAVSPGIFFPSSRTVSSHVSQKYVPSMYRRPMVYVGCNAMRFNVSFI